MRLLYTSYIYCAVGAGASVPTNKWNVSSLDGPTAPQVGSQCLVLVDSAYARGASRPQRRPRSLDGDRCCGAGVVLLIHNPVGNHNPMRAKRPRGSHAQSGRRDRGAFPRDVCEPFMAGATGQGPVQVIACLRRQDAILCSSVVIEAKEWQSWGVYLF